MPNGYEHKEYGEHKYANHDYRSDCEYGCGCWIGQSNSDGPLGLDPFGKCPNNPKDGKQRPGKIDYEDVVTQRIRGLEARAITAERTLKAVSPDKNRLVKTIENLKKKLFRLEHTVSSVKQCLKGKW